MLNKTRRLLFVACGASLCLAVSALSSCASIPVSEVKQEKGYYYGFGSGKTSAEASDTARRDLISKALSESARRDGSKKGRIEISAESAKVFKLPNLDTVTEEKTPDSITIVYRVKSAEFDTFEQARETALRTEMAEKLAVLKDGFGMSFTERMKGAGALLDRLYREGLAEVLTEGAAGGLMSAAVESFCRDISAGLVIQASPDSGFVGSGATFAVQAMDRDGRPAEALPLNVVWTAAETEPLSVALTTGRDGSAVLRFPSEERFKDKSVRARITTAFAAAAPRSAGLKAIDAAGGAEIRCRHFEDAAGYFDAEVLIPGGTFTAGAVVRDKRATKKETPRQAETQDVYMAVRPVTNAMYAIFLEDTRAETFPDYWDNAEYNGPDQPVIGITLEDANAYAAWLSRQLGATLRLPTEDEWEKAARGGQDVIYPWGDQSPADGARANYNGNGRFTGTSPVGSFEEGKNAYGLYDMAGNVWQWTSTARSAGKAIVKGGSWMDGPTELRVSARREADPAKGYVDVGFRLVREVAH